MAFSKFFQGHHTTAGDIAAPPAMRHNRRADLRMLAFEISLGAVAGGAGGILVGGIGGRIAMLILRLTSDSSVNGVRSDDGFVIGRFSVDTLNLLAAGAALGSIVGLLIIAGRPFLPWRWMPFAWSVSGGLCGGALLINPDGVDFTLLAPLWLAVVLFVALPAVGALVIAWLLETMRAGWWRNRRMTLGLAAAALPAVIFIPIGIATLIVAGGWFAVLRVDRLRTMHEWVAARALAVLVFTGISAAFGAQLYFDVVDTL